MYRKGGGGVYVCVCLCVCACECRTFVLVYALEPPRAWLNPQSLAPAP